MRIVLDTNVLLPAFFSAGLCHALLERIYELGGEPRSEAGDGASDEASGETHVELVLSEHILAEFEEWATVKFRAPERDVGAALQLLRSTARLVTPVPVDPSVIDDVDDLPVIGTAIAGRADALVTGDKALVALGSVGGIAIATPRSMYDHLVSR